MSLLTNIVENLVVDKTRDTDLYKLLYDNNSRSWKTGHDILAQSWASFHKWDYLEGPRYSELDTLIPDERDIEMAEKTRTYYRDRIMMRMLNSKPLSPFQRDLYAVLNGAQWTLGHRGMAYKLPFFYTEDQERALVQQEFANAPIVQNTDYVPPGLPTVRLLTPVRRILSVVKQNESMAYWWRDQNSVPILWTVKLMNPLRSLINHWHSACPHLRVEASYHMRPHPNKFCYWTVHNPKVTNV